MADNTNNKRTLIAGLGWSYAERLLAQLVTLLVSIVLARVLSPEHYGVISIVTVFITIGDALVVGGFGNALVQKKDADRKDFNSICWVSLSLSALIYCILFFCAPLVSFFYENDMLTAIIRVMGLKLVFSAFNSVQQAYVQKNMMFRKFFFSTLGGTLLSSVVGIVMALTGCGIWSLVAQYMTNSIVNTIVLFFTIDWKPKLELSWKSVKELWSYGAKVLGSTLVYTVRDNIRTLIIGKQFTEQDLAFYNQGQKYPSLVVTDIVEALGKVLFPAMSSWQTEKEKITGLMRTSIRLSSYLLTPLLFGLLAVSDSFVEVVLTEKWMDCVPFMRIMCLVYVTRSLSTIFQKGLLSIGKSNLNLIHETVTSTITILLLLVAVFAFESVTLIAWSHVVVTLIGVILYVIWVGKYLRYRLLQILQDYLPSLLMSAIMAVSVYFIGWIPMATILTLILQVVAGVMIYVLLSVITKNQSFYYLLGLFKSLLKKRKGETP